MIAQKNDLKNAQGFQLKIGADPEIFITDEMNNPVSAHDIIPGTKSKPFKVERGALQVDGVAAEFNIHPCTDLVTWFKHLHVVQGQLQRYVNNYNEKFFKTYKLSSSVVASFTKPYWENSVPEHCKELGCDPDYNAEKRSVNPAHTFLNDRAIRLAGGHIHLGWVRDIEPTEEFHFLECCEVVQQLDAVLWTTSFLWDSDNFRRSFYGRKGTFRPKTYGVEYRTLSNAWLRSTETEAWVFLAAQLAYHLYQKGTRLYEDLFIMDYLTKLTLHREEAAKVYTHLVNRYGFSTALMDFVHGNP